MKIGRAALAVLVIASLFAASTGDARGLPVPGFPVLGERADPSSLTFSQRYVIDSAFGGKLPSELWQGSVQAGRGKVTAVGNEAKICLVGSVALTGPGFCANTPSVRAHGLIYVGLPSHGTSPTIAVTGLVPSGVRRVAIVPSGRGGRTRTLNPLRGVFTTRLPADEEFELVGRSHGRTVVHLSVGR
jgi:hypothetical protein